MATSDGHVDPTTGIFVVAGDEEVTPTKYVRRWRWVYTSVFGPIVLMVLVLAALQVYPFSDIVIKGISVENKVYQAGDIVTIESHGLCWNGVKFTSSRWLVTGATQRDIGFVRMTGYPLKASGSIDPNGCFPDGFPVARVQIPYDTPAGEHHFLFEIEYRPVPFHTENIELTSNSFVVEGS